MALPLKSGADLYNQQLIRAAVWNYSADGLDPSEYATGLMYFNTNPSSNMYQKLRFRTATDWKTIAFAEDLDVATNKDFKALKEKVELLSGEVDTDAIINNMKEVTAFLEGFAEDANLMSVLDGKLDKTGGTIQGSNEAGTADTPLIVKSANRIYTAISLQTPEKEAINLRWYNQYGVVLANSSASTWIVLGEDKSLYYTTDGAVTKHTLLHSGNIGDYAVKTKGDSTIVDGSLLFQGGYIKFLLSDGSFLGGFNISGNTGKPIFLTQDEDWKTIAFTDSNVASATKLETPRTIWGQSFDGTGNVDGMITVSGFGALHRDDTALWVNYGGGDAEKNLCLCGNRIAFYSGKASNFNAALLINQQGNVLIGTTDDNGAKLQVDGKAHIKNQLYGLGSYGGASFEFGLRANEAVSVERFDSAGNWLGYGLLLTTDGKVAVNRISPKATFHVGGSIVADSTIACKGVAEEGSAPVGTVDKWAGSIAIGTKSQTYTHGLGTTDITVAIYEKNGNEWVQILTDVDIVNANTIRVTFGANTTVEHRIIVMG